MDWTDLRRSGWRLLGCGRGRIGRYLGVCRDDAVHNGQAWLQGWATPLPGLAACIPISGRSGNVMMDVGSDDDEMG